MDWKLSFIALGLAAGWMLVRYLRREDYQRELRTAYDGLAKARGMHNAELEAYWEKVIADLETGRTRQHNEP